jgi:hypothetical protein
MALRSPGQAANDGWREQEQEQEQTGPVVQSWRIGGRDEVAWINEGTSVGTTITAAVPPVFARYATVVVPEGDAERT